MLSALVVASALAATPAEPLPSALAPALRLSDEPAVDGAASKPKRSFLMEVGFRGRYLTVGDFILDYLAYPHDEADDTYPERPDVNAYTLGLEFVVKEGSANGIFYVEFLNPMTEAGYWDDIESTPNHSDGSWIKPVNLAAITVGADYAYELKATHWLSFLFGAGLGAGFILGDLYEWQPGEDDPDVEGDNNNYDPTCGQGAPAYDRVDDCHHDQELVADGVMPPVIPMIDINVGIRFNISNRASIRLEGGLHTMFYGGGAVSVVF